MVALEGRRRTSTRLFSTIALRTAALFATCLLAGCATGNFLSTDKTPVISPIVPTVYVTPHGNVHGGQQPVAGATIQIWQVGTTGYGVGATPLGSSTLTSSEGNFSFASDFNCANALSGNNTLVYITATGGNPGLSGTVNNGALSMIVALGACGSLNATSFVSINEVTTIATVYALAQFIGPNGLVGSYGTTGQGLANAFANVNNLVNIATGAALAQTPNGNGIVPQSEIYTLADMLAPCVNSAGPTSPDCSSLFSLTTPPNGAAPTNTVGAAVNIALNPANNVSQLLVLPTPTAPYHPVVNSLNDLTIAIGFASGGSNADSLAVDATGNVWISNRGTGGNTSSLSLITALGVPASNSPYVSQASVNGAAAVAIDTGNNAWLVSHDNNTATAFSASLVSKTYTVNIANGPFTSIGLNLPTAVAVDGNNDIWFVNSGNNSLTELFNNNYNGNNGTFTNVALSAPGGIAFDNADNLWAANTGGASIVKINAQATALTAARFTGGGITSPSALAIDGSTNVWVTDANLSQVAEVNSAGAPVSSNAGYTGGGITGSLSDAIDGNGNVWIADSIGNRISELSSAGAALTPSTGLQGGALSAPSSVAIDPAGDLWLANATPTTVSGLPITVTEFIGLASPVVTPLALAVQQGQLAKRPGSTLPPVARSGGPYTGSQFVPVEFNAAASYDPANLPAGAAALGFSWDFGDGSTAQGPGPVHTYTTAGAFTVTVVATSASGMTSIATTSATIAAGTAVAGTPTTVIGGPYAGTAGTAVAFNGGGSTDPNGLTLIYNWQFGDGAGATVANPTHVYAQAGTYSVGLVVGNGTSQSSATTIANIAAAVMPAFVVNPGGPYTATVNQPVSFNASQTNSPAGRQLSYSWTFGDGSIGTGAAPVHVYSNAGTYTVGLSVTDGATANGSSSTQATVSGPAAEAITAAAGGPYKDVTGHTIIFNASGSNDNLGNPVTYAWNFGDGGTSTGATPSHAYTSVGTYTATVTVSSATATATSSVSVAITAAITVAITSPTANMLFGTNTVTVSGTLSQPNLTVSVNGTPAQVSGSTFTASGVSLREGVNLISASAMDGNGGIGTGVVSVIMDATAPTVSITSPATGGTVTSSTVAVTGLVNDIVTGTIGSNNVTVTVNGLAAQVNNRSYLLPSLQLVPGANVITVVATDNVGNTSQTVSSIQFLPPTSQLSIVKVTGDGQTALAKTVLPQPLQVQLVSASGTPVVGRPVTFTVTRSDGNVEVLPTIAQTIAVTTDANGKASALFQLGSRSGLGINQVSATTPGAAGAAVFTETSTLGTAAAIHIVLGENQRGLLGQSLGQALQVIVMDANSNPVPGVTVNYSSVGATDGTLDNAAPITDANGKAIANLTLGQQEGVQNYVVTADFAGDTGGAVTFSASAFAPGPMSATTVSGVVLDNTNIPVPNATVTIQNTNLSTVTNASGTFTLSGAPVGAVTLTVDGSTSTSPKTLPFLSFVLQDLPGQNNTIGKAIYLPTIDINDAQTVGASDPVTLTMAGVPGVAFTIAPNSVTFPDGSKVGKLSLSQVKSDMVPMPPTNGSGPDLIWTLQPAGTRFSVPVQVTLPNTQALPPGTVSEMYQYDHDLEQFVSIGTGHVSADGSVITTDPGFGITKAGWGHGPVLQVPGACSFSCNPSTECMNIARSQTTCNCINTPLTGKACGKPLQTDANGNYQSCQLQGMCNSSGVCDGQTVPAGLPCVPKPNFCDTGATCNGGGTCVSSGTIDDQVANSTQGGAGDTVTASKTLSQAWGYANDALKKYLGLGYINATFMVGVSAGNETYHCCEATKTLNTLVTDDSISPVVTISSPKEPLIIGGVPFGFPLPFGDAVGFYVQAAGSLTLSFTHHKNTCTSEDCKTFTFNPALTLILGLNAIPNDVISASVQLTGGISFMAVGGCGMFTATIGSLPIVSTGSITLASGTFLETNVAFNHTLVNAVAFGKFTYPSAQ